MNCRELEARINEVLDNRGSLDGDPELARHARECAICAGLLASTRELLAGVALLDVPPCDPQMADRVIRELRTPERRVSVGLYRVAAVASLATAAALLLGAMLVFTAPEGPAPIVEQTEDLPQPSSEGVAVVQPGDFNRDDLDRDMVVKLWRETRESVDGIPTLLTGQPESSGDAAAPAQPDGGIDGLAESVAGSFGFLLDVLADADGPPQS